MRALLGVGEVDNIMSLLVFGESVSGDLLELEQVGGRTDVFLSFIDGYRLAPLLVVALLAGSRQFLAAYPAHVLNELGATSLGAHEGPRG
jgi:hypothetical protein